MKELFSLKLVEITAGDICKAQAETGVRYGVSKLNFPKFVFNDFKKVTECDYFFQFAEKDTFDEDKKYLCFDVEHLGPYMLLETEMVGDMADFEFCKNGELFEVCKDLPKNSYSRYLQYLPEISYFIVSIEEYGNLEDHECIFKLEKSLDLSSI